METINFNQLAVDGFSLSVRKLVLIHGITHEVRRSDITGKYFLENTSGPNDEVFRKFRLVGSKYRLARVYEENVDSSGSFPEFNHLDNLTKFVVWLIKTPLFKVGDKVKISKYKTGENYPFGFNDGMQKHSGDIATIAHIEAGLKNHSYGFKEFGYTWSENQFELVSEAEESIYTEEYEEEKPKKDITYGDLIDGYILQDYDAINIAGIPYRVHCGINGNFLYVAGDAYDKIFTLLGIKEKDDFCKKFGELASTGSCFPEFKTMEGLTKCVIELMERAEHIPVSPEPFAVSMDYGSGSSTPIVVSSKLRPSSTTDTGIVRLPEIKDDFKIIL